jgi:hypothetical protein
MTRMFLKRILGLFENDNLPRGGFLVRRRVPTLRRSYRELFSIFALFFNMEVNGERVSGLPRQTFSAQFPEREKCRRWAQNVGNCFDHAMAAMAICSLCAWPTGECRESKNALFWCLNPFLNPPTHFWKKNLCFVGVSVTRPFQRYTTRGATGPNSRG